MIKMGKAIFSVSPRVLEKMFLLPDGYTIEDIHANSERCFSILVDGPSLPEYDEDAPLPRINPIYRKNEDGSPELVNIGLSN